MTVHDLTLPLADGTAAGFGLPPARVRLWQPRPERGWWATEILLPSHIGTHVDAPRHFLDDGGDVAGLDLDVLIGAAVVLDLRGRPDPAQVRLEDLQRAAPPPGVERWLLCTGWDAAAGTPRYFSDYPALSPETVDWLLDRGVRLLGLDTPTLGRRDNPGMHRRLLGAGVVVVEGLCGLAALVGRTFTLCVLPPRLRGADGAPVRAVAIDPEPGGPS